MKKLTTIIFLISFFYTIQSQNIKKTGSIPFIKYFSPEQYKAAPRNWSATQDNRGILYFANDNGNVLEYDGTNWRSIKVTVNSPVRAVSNINNRIYVGGYNTFGYLKPNKQGTLEYFDLSSQLPAQSRNFQDIWDIFLTKDSSIFFQSFEKIFIYKNGNFTVINIDSVFAQGIFLISFQVNREIYVYVKYKGIYQLEKNKLVYLPYTERIGNSFVRAIVPYNDKKMLLFTWYDGVFFFDKSSLTHIKTSIDDLIKTNIYRATQIYDKYYLIQLYEGGILIIDKNFNIVQKLKAPDDLQNDKIFRTFVDNQNNLWLCSAKGITTLYPLSPYTIFDKRHGLEVGTNVITAKVFNNYIFLGTNTGLYYTKLNNDQINSESQSFKLLPNQYGNTLVRNIKIFNNKIFLCSDGGLFFLKEENKKKVDFIEKIKYNPILINRSIYDIIQDVKDTNTMYGISSAFFIFKKQKDKWSLLTDNQQFKGHFILQDEFQNIWLSDIYEGLTILKVDEQNQIKLVDRINSENYLQYNLPTYQNIGIFRISSNIVYTTPKGVFTFNYQTKKFEPFVSINNILGESTFLNFIVNDFQNNLWFKKQVEENGQINWYLGCISNDKTLKINQFNFLKNNIYSFNILDTNIYAIGTDFGFVHYDATIKQTSNKFNSYIRTVQILSYADSIIFGGTFIDKDSTFITFQPNEKIPILPFKFNNLRFTFACNYFSNTHPAEYSFILEGQDKNWSSWTKETYKDYSNIPKGTYTFKVKARNVYNEESTIASYTFTIKPPFYLTIWAILIYIATALLLVFAIVRIYTYRLLKQKEYLEEQVRIRTKEIEQKKEEIAAQRDELARKNEEIEKINKDITSSIEYAKRIQTAMLPLESTISEYLKDYFILFKPRDIVSGDFYWFTTKENKIFIAAVDCTGHGVPGAFMSMIGSQMLTTIVNVKNIVDADQILSELNDNIRNALKQDTTDTQDGMDMALCVIDINNQSIEFAGAKNPLYFIHDNQIEVFKGSKQAIGGFQYEKFKKYNINYQSPAYFYIFTDGYADQFGGPENTKFMVGRFKELLLNIYQLDMQTQKEKLDEAIIEWMKNVYQTDDILIIGFKL